MNRLVCAVAFALGLMAVGWVGVGFIGTSPLALVMTVAIAGVYLLGAFEIKQFRAASASLAAALVDIPPALPDLRAWLGRLHPSWRNAVRLRIEGERVALPAPALTPYLVGLLVMLGMLGTFLGMVVTFKGAVFALEGSTDLQAIRSALAAPIKGLGLSFGTSVAGVATSSMLGLLSALSRGERLDVARLLDTRIAHEFRPFSRAHQREESFKALQVQARALPEVVDKLHALMDGLERRHQQLNAQLLDQQAQFHREAGTAYTGLAREVGQSLKDSLVSSAKMAGDTIKPVVEAAMSEIALESTRVHQRQVEAAQAQLNGVSAQFSATAQTVSEGWAAALHTHARTSEGLVDGLDRSLRAFAQTFEQRSGALLATVNEAASASQAGQALADEQRLQVWTRALAAMATGLQGEWQQVGAHTLAQQNAVCLTLEKTASEITERISVQSGQTLSDVARLLTQSEALVQSRVESEAHWMQHHRERMDQLSSVWRTELGTLRDDEAARGDAALDRLNALQSAMASHLSTLGAALEAPMTRLMQTASDVPQAAAHVIAQLRQEMNQLAEQGNLALEERRGLVEKITVLLQGLNQASSEQRVAIESLVTSATQVLEQASSQFAHALHAQSGQSADVAAHLTGSAVELSSLGESFGHGVQLFSASNDKLLDSLHRIEASINQSTARSDEQLAYYVAQAREVIDLSISSQHGIVEDMRRLHREAADVRD